MHKFLISHQQTRELFYGFKESEATKRLELTTNKLEKRFFFLRIQLRDLFGFADQETMTYGLGYKLKLKRNINNNDPIFRTVGLNAAKKI